MDSISVREFQLHAKRYLKQLPIDLTVMGWTVARIVPTGVNTREDKVTVKPINKSTPVNTEKEKPFIPNPLWLAKFGKKGKK